MLYFISLNYYYAVQGIKYNSFYYFQESSQNI